MSERPRAADDFAAIRARLEELKREREPKPDDRCASCRERNIDCTGACYCFG
jgi:hypothetical protein